MRALMVCQWLPWHWDGRGKRYADVFSPVHRHRQGAASSFLLNGSIFTSSLSSRNDLSVPHPLFDCLSEEKTRTHSFFSLLFLEASVRCTPTVIHAIFHFISQDFLLGFADAAMQTLVRRKPAVFYDLLKRS